MTTDNPFKTYSCRFEFTHDFTAFIVEAHKRGVRIDTSELHHHKKDGVVVAPDCYVEFKTEAPLQALQVIMDKGPDLHVGLETLRPVPIADNSMERDSTAYDPDAIRNAPYADW